MPRLKPCPTAWGWHTPASMSQTDAGPANVLDHLDDLASFHGVQSGDECGGVRQQNIRQFF